jgi:nucleotide-binding universal stress UspA family protein
MFDVILVGADDSLTARRAVEAACEICAMSKGTLHIVTAFEQLTMLGGADTHEFKVVIKEADGRALLQTLSFIAQKHDVQPVLHSAKGDAADVLIAKADEVGADLIVVGNRGMKGVRRVLGSVPNSVAHGANCSVLIVDTTD